MAEYRGVAEHPAAVAECSKTGAAFFMDIADNALDSANDGYIHIKLATERAIVGLNTRFDFADCRGDMIATAEEKSPGFSRLSGSEGENPFVETKSLKLTIAARLAEILGGHVLASDNPSRPRVLSLIVPLGPDI